MEIKTALILKETIFSIKTFCYERKCIKGNEETSYRKVTRSAPKIWYLKKKIFITNKYCLSLPSFEMIPRNFISPLFAKIIKVLLPFNNNSI